MGLVMKGERLRLENVRKNFSSGPEQVEVLGGLSFTQRNGEFLTLVGPSGCGKTTTLRSIAGLLPRDSGTILHRGKEESGVSEGLSVVFQDYTRSLFPWLSVSRNVAMPLIGADRQEREERARDVLELVGLGEFGDHYPWQLSGGMQQRVAIARAVVAEPDLLLMDEPFASVDAQTRTYMEDMLMGLWEKLSISVLFITHDIDEAIYLADRILVLSSRPTRVIEDIQVPIGRPRNQIDTKALPEYQALRERIYGLIQGPAVSSLGAH